MLGRRWFCARIADWCGRVLVREGAADVHQTAAILADHALCASGAQRIGLVPDHGAGDVGLLDGEGAAEAAAFGLACLGRDLDVVQLADQ